MLSRSPTPPSAFTDLLHSPRVRQAVKVSLDILLGMVAWILARKLEGGPQLNGQGVMIWGGVCLFASFFGSLWRQHYRTTSFGDFLRIVWAGVALVLAATGLGILQPLPGIGYEVWIVASLLTTLAWGFLRALVRGIYDLRTLDTRRFDTKPTLVVGAGRAGVLMADEIQRHPELGSRVVGFIDDDFTKQGVLIHGIPVLGTQELIPKLVREYEIQRIILAIPSAPGPVIRQLSESMLALGVEIKTVPGLFNLLGDQSWKPELRDISIEDLLRREPVVLDQEGLRGTLENRVVLITGAGGSIGSELARQVCRFRPSRLVLLGRGENSLWGIERELRQAFPNQQLSLELCDIRNSRRIEQAFSKWKPSVVFHAAAHKHVPFLEQHPEEAIENNVFGTRNVLEAALRHSAQHVVNISTDKAVNPTNVLGASKRIAEYLVMDAATKASSSAQFVSVRFGNVLGSRGSVVPIFRDQIALGGPVSVTHPDMTRFFMTIPEASQLVLQSGLLGESGKVYVLNMGEPVRIVDLAMDMIRLSGLEPGQDIDIVFSGTRPGEKLYEELFYNSDRIPSLVHPKVYEADLECDAALPISEILRQLELALDSKTSERYSNILKAFQDHVPHYQPASNGLAKFAKHL